jgi:hypothetical protein
MTSASRGGAGEQKIMEQSGHRSIEVARRYIRRAFRRGARWDRDVLPYPVSSRGRVNAP